MFSKIFSGRRIAFFIVITLVTGAVIIEIISLCLQDSPVEKIEEGRRIIAQAKVAEAEIYSSKELLLAEKYWQEAMNEWKASNNKIPVLRNYDKTLALADLSVENAKTAKNNAIKRRYELHLHIERSINTLRSDAIYIELVTGKLPLTNEIRKKLTPVSLKLTEIESAFNRNNLLSAKAKLEQVKVEISELKSLTTDLLENYFSSFPQWIKLDEEMKLWSKKNNAVSLVVDKFSRKCIIYKSGRKIKDFNVELGINWLGDKVQSGDRATPEGRYSVIAKKSGSNTTYHKSLEINFPNDDDKRRFNKGKDSGDIAKNSTIGGSISIHGGGGKEIDWTEGCVALNNSDMDKLFALCPVGTPVVIVGSLLSPEKIFEEIQK